MSKIITLTPKFIAWWNARLQDYIHSNLDKPFYATKDEIEYYHSISKALFEAFDNGDKVTITIGDK